MTRRWPVWTFRVLTTVSAILLFDQAIFAGQFLAGDYDAVRIHGDNASLAGIAVFLTTVSAGLLRWPGRGPWWPLAAYGLLCLLVVAQIVMGYRRVIGVHVPLGVAMIALAVGLCVWAWRGLRWQR